MESSSTSKLGPNLGPKLGPNKGPKLGPNTGPKLGPYKGPKLENNGPKLQSGPIIGIHGLPIGPGRPGTQKMENPCNLFKNTENSERALNTEKVSNMDFALNIERNITFKSNYDILHLLKTHPDFERIPPDQLQPIVAAVLSGLMAGGGFLLLCFPPTSAAGSTAIALSVKAIGGALMSGGMAGVENAWQHGVQGTFSWKKWSRDVAVSTVIGGLTVGITVAASWITTSPLLLQLNAKLLGVEYLEYVARCAVSASTLIGGMFSTCGEAIKKVIKDEKINPLMLIIAFVTGALSGYKIGKEVTNLQIVEKLKALAQNPDELAKFYYDFWTNQEKFYVHVKDHAHQIERVSFNTENAKSFMVLSKDSLDALKDLEKSPIVQYGKTSIDILQKQGAQFAEVKFPGDVHWKRVFYDERTRLYAITSIHDEALAGPIPGRPDKLLTVHKMKTHAKWMKKVAIIEGQRALGLARVPNNFNF